MEVVLVDNGAAVETFRAKDEIERLTDSRFSAIVPSNQKGVAGKIDNAGGNAAEVLNGQPADSHGLVPLQRCFWVSVQA